MRFAVSIGWLLLSFGLVVVWSGCGRTDEAVSTSEAFPMRLQMGWNAQPERGGFVQGVTNGHFAERGLEVTLLKGGPKTNAGAMLVAGDADIAELRLEEALALIEKGFPILLVGACMQHDPQAIMVHAESGVHSFKDLEGQRVLARPGAPFLDVIKKRFAIEFEVLPLSNSLAFFMKNRDVAQQCFITSEPFYMQQQGMPIRTLLLADAGFDLCRVLGVNNEFAKAHPEQVRAFVEGMEAGWQDYLFSENYQKAHDLMLEMNPGLDPEGLLFARKVLKEEKLIVGKETLPRMGYLDTERLIQAMQVLVDIGFLSKELPVEAFVAKEFFE